jgi:hypothetical protein
MRTILILFALAILGGCASLQPTAVNPNVTYITNDLKAVTAAAGGNCSIVITPPTGVSLATDCAPLDPTVTTVSTNETTYGLCFNDAATGQIGARVSAAASGLQAQLCAQQGKTVGPAPVVITPVPTPVVPAVKH